MVVTTIVIYGGIRNDRRENGKTGLKIQRKAAKGQGLKGKTKKRVGAFWFAIFENADSSYPLGIDN